MSSRWPGYQALPFSGSSGFSTSASAFLSSECCDWSGWWGDLGDPAERVHQARDRRLLEETINVHLARGGTRGTRPPGSLLVP